MRSFYFTCSSCSSYKLTERVLLKESVIRLEPEEPIRTEAPRLRGQTSLLGMSGWGVPGAVEGSVLLEEDMRRPSISPPALASRLRTMACGRVNRFKQSRAVMEMGWRIRRWRSGGLEWASPREATTASISWSSGLRSTEEELGDGGEKPGALFELALVDGGKDLCRERLSTRRPHRP
jgi:hypothetical protein